jgi:hypothetical protein
MLTAVVEMINAKPSLFTDLICAAQPHATWELISELNTKRVSAWAKRAALQC